MVEIVISRFNEDISWINGLNCKITIYNKGEPCGFNAIKLENVGREATTILYHIINNYNNLAEYTAFLQGNPFEHAKNAKQIISALPNNISKLYKFSEGCYAIADKILNETQSSISKFNVFPEDFYKTFFLEPNSKFFYASGAQYLVHRDNIKNKEIGFYKTILNSYEWKNHEPWSIERNWPMIFDREDKYKHKQAKMFL